MIKRKQPVWYIFLALCLQLFSSCDHTRVIDEYKNIEQTAWYYKTRLPFDVQIKDTAKMYNILVNLRVGADYKYSNIFMLVHTLNPDKKSDQRRIEIKLADESGKWLGSGLGSVYDYRFPAFRKVKFPQPGFYRFELEQNMRDDTLMFIHSAGIRVEEISD
ncbi:MAG: gliding motility lipoprotein GldH [Bacteroidia bacterium]|jgi:gliding motility-associated lipoprotein GldH|nr:gliding motility lipoprotein GldH [Bacteroidia bacterium]